MKLVLIPPYLNPAINASSELSELLNLMEQGGLLEDVELDIDEGYFTENQSPIRDEEFLAHISVGVVKKVKEYSEMGKHDAIVLSGSFDPGFTGGRAVSRIPITGAMHSSLHFASLIGERCCHIDSVVSSALMIRHCAERYGFGHKLVSARYTGHTTTEMHGLVTRYSKEEWTRVPEIKKIIDDITTQCVAAIEKDRVDSIILGCEPIQLLGDEVSQRLDEMGYDEIPLIRSLFAAVAMAKAMVNMKIAHVPRAYPSGTLRAKPEYW